MHIKKLSKSITSVGGRGAEGQRGTGERSIHLLTILFVLYADSDIAYAVRACVHVCVCECALVCGAITQIDMFTAIAVDTNSQSCF